MPMDRNLYPDNWDAIALAIKESVGWRCEACGRPCRKPGETREAAIFRLTLTDHETVSELWEAKDPEPSVSRLGRFTLTVAHLDHVPQNCDRSNLRAWCAPCHCRYDLRAMAQKKQLKLERLGQLRLEGL